METTNVSTTTPPAATVSDKPATPPRVSKLNLPALLRRRSVWMIGAILFLVVAALAYHWTFGKASVRYTTATVERGDVESTVVAAGVLQPVKYVDVGAQTSGMLKSLKVQRGDQVTEGQLLAEIDPVLANTALTSANAMLESITSQRNSKQAELALAKTQMARNDTLFAQGIISANDRDVARAAYKSSLADVESLAAQMKQATAAVATATANVGYTKIVAPMAGQVVSIATLEGQTINANQQAPTILRIADMSMVTVWAQVSEADIVNVKVDQDVYFTVLGQTKRWTSKIKQILPTPELINNVVFYDVLFDIPNPDGNLEIQMTAQVFIILDQAKGVLMIPTAAIGNANAGDEVKVQVMKPNGSVELRTIKIGITSEISAEVKEGLKEGEKVVVGQTAAKTGTKKSPLTPQRGR